MELSSTDGLDLYIDEEVDENNSETKRVSLDRDLEVGETAYFRNSYRNKIIKHGDDSYMFYRFDEIQTHVEDYESGYTFDDLGEVFTSELDYNLEYSGDRVEQLERLLNDNEWVYNLLSENRTIIKEQKKKNSFLAEDQRLDSYFQRLVDYILHPKFNSFEEEQYYLGLESDYKELQNKNAKTNSETTEMMRLKEEIDLINNGIISRSREERNKKREDFTESFAALEEKEVEFETEFTREKSNISHKKLDITDDYWSKMGFSEESGSFRKEILYEYEVALSILIKQLGHGLPKEEKKQRQKDLIKSLEPIRYQNGKREVTITPEMRFHRLGRLYSELKSDYNKAKEILATIVSFNQVDPSFSKYNFTNDTRYIDKNGKTVEVSKNMLLFSEIDTYKGIILNYYDLKEKYYDKFEDDMWYILVYFEELLEKSDLTSEERFVVKLAMQDDNRHEIIESFERKFETKLSAQKLSQWLNRIIPNKILNTYLDSMDEWIYTYKVLGKFKKCNRCKEIKLTSNDRYFGTNNRNKDGKHTICRSCRS